MSSRDIANLKQGLVAAWIPSLGSTGYRLVDRVGSNHGVLTNMDAGSDWVVNNGNLALDFDGSNDLVALPLTSQLISVFTSNVWSICGWCYVRSFSNSPVIWTLGAPLNNNDSGLLEFNNTGFQVYVKSANQASGLTNARTYTLATAASTSSWMHLCFNKSGTGDSGSFYVNGKLETNYSGTLGTCVVTDSITQRFASYGGTVAPLNGLLDDWRLYSRTLSATEVSLLSKERGIGFKTSSRTSSHFAKRYSYKPPKDKTYAAITRSQSDYDSLREGLVLAICPSITQGSGYRAPDLSGRGNHGTVTNADLSTFWKADGGVSANFDGTNDYVRTNLRSVSFPFSESVFVKPSALQTGYICGFAASSSNGPMMGLYYNSSGNFGLHAEVNGNQLIVSPSTYAINNWYHVCGVWRSATDRELFVNGVSVGTSTASVLFASTIDRFTLGVFDRLSPSAYFNGQVDDARVYSRALSATEISLLSKERGIGLAPRPRHYTYYQFPSASRRRKLITGMP